MVHKIMNGCCLVAVALLPVGVNSTDRPLPPIVDPGSACVQNEERRPPSDAVVLFSGIDLAAWRSATGEPAPWRTEDDYMEIVPGSGAIRTDQSFGDCQLHLEWRTPTPATGTGQDRGNSGVYFMETVRGSGAGFV